MNEQLIRSFYTSFQAKDWKGMQACYHDEIIFSDPVFQHLKGPEAKAMWHMLTSASKDLILSFQNAKASEDTGSCDWAAHYTFSKSGRKVHNIIQAKFEFSNGKIIRHIDYFDLWRWAGMALGFPGKMLGWSPLLHSKIRGTARRSLDKFIEAHPEYRH